jgi:hypothetical protein
MVIFVTIGDQTCRQLIPASVKVFYLNLNDRPCRTTHGHPTNDTDYHQRKKYTLL